MMLSPSLISTSPSLHPPRITSRPANSHSPLLPLHHTQAVKLDSRDTPPPLHFSPAASDRERSSTAETTPISTPRALATGFPRKPEKESLFSWHHKRSGFAGPSSAYVDSALLDSDFEDSTFPLFNEPSGSIDMESRSRPIEVATASGHVSPRSPPHTSNLTSALQTTSGNGVRSTSAMDANDQYKGFGSDLEGSANAPQHGTAAQPISVRSSNRELNREQPRRESLASSMVTGMSWGGNSVGSWIRDDIIMQGTSPFAYRSPSFHSASYLPKLEANFMRDFTCCGLTLPSLHDLLQHYEENHSDQVPASLPQKNANQNDTQPDARAARATVATSNIQNQVTAQQRPPQIDTSNRGQITPQASPPPVTPRQSQPAQQITRGFAPSPPSPPFQSQDDEAVGDMEMDDDYGAGLSNTQQAQYPMPNQGRITQRSQFGQPSSSRVPPLDMNMLNINNPLQQQHQALRNSQPTTPVSTGRNGTIYHNNPTVSSVNTPTLSTYNSAHPLQNQYCTPESSAPGTPGELDEEFVGGLGNMNVGNTHFMQNSAFGYPSGNGHDMLDLCIDEPAKRLLAQNGGYLSGFTQPQQSATTSSATQLGDGQYSEDSQLARTIREEQKRAGVPDPSADGGTPKPFHCPVIGCEKAYKNQNGLKYHKSHGHNTQKLAANDNGTFSIVDPETLKAYPGTLGMEKHKPYRCDICGKRYKNVNGLKYHKVHSPNCSSGIQIPPSTIDLSSSSRQRGQPDQMVM